MSSFLDIRQLCTSQHHPHRPQANKLLASMHGQYTKACQPSKFSLSSEGQNSSVKKQSNLVSSVEEAIPDNIQINVLPAGDSHVQLDLVSKIGSDIMNAEPFGNTQFKIMDG